MSIIDQISVGDPIESGCRDACGSLQFMWHDVANGHPRGSSRWASMVGGDHRLLDLPILGVWIGEGPVSTAWGFGGGSEGANADWDSRSISGVIPHVVIYATR
jgi:hypothetical protein